MNHPLHHVFILALLFSICFGNKTMIAQDSTADSTVTPFRTGRWLTGIAGTISSSVNEAKSTDERASSNEYSLNIVGGNFFRDRWLVGGIVQMTRSDADGLADLNTESFIPGATCFSLLLGFRAARCIYHYHLVYTRYNTP